MTSLLTPPAAIQTLADLLDRLGGISAERVRFHPAPGTATETDVIEVDAHEDRLCELVDGVLVEKAMGLHESLLAIALAGILRMFVIPRNLGLVSGADGPFRLFPGLVRLPDVAFVSWDRIPGGRVPEAPIPDLAPDLAVEVLSDSNTKLEMARKLGEYFAAGVRLVWMIEPKTRTVTIHDAPDRFTMLDASQTLDGGDVLPGFALPLSDLFAELDRQGNS
jgi:Uma2 family endonuclease